MSFRIEGEVFTNKWDKMIQGGGGAAIKVMALTQIFSVTALSST